MIIYNPWVTQLTSGRVETREFESKMLLIPMIRARESRYVIVCPCFNIYKMV